MTIFDDVAVGDRWVEIGMDHEGSWRVVKVQTDKVGLSGPGPFRSYREVPLGEFLSEWERTDSR